MMTEYDPTLAPRSLADEVVPNEEQKVERDKLLASADRAREVLQLVSSKGWDQLMSETTERLLDIQTRLFTGSTAETMDQIQNLRGRAQELSWIMSLEEWAHSQIEYVDGRLAEIEEGAE